MALEDGRKPPQRSETESGLIERAKAGRDPYTHVGRGGEKTVYLHPDDKSKVLSVWHKEGMVVGSDFIDDPIYKPHPQMSQRERNRFKRQYCLIKILHILYPDNIPDIHAVSTEPRMMIRDRVINSKRRFDPRTPEEVAEEKRMVSEFDKIGIPFDKIGMDNFRLAESGHMVYTDTFFFDASKDPYDNDVTIKQEAKIADNLEDVVRQSLSGETQESALHYLRRFRTLLTVDGEAKAV